MINNLSIQDMRCFERASETQLEVFRRCEHKIYELEKMDNCNIAFDLLSFVTQRGQELSLLTVQKDINRFQIMVNFFNHKEYVCRSIGEILWEELARAFKGYLLLNGYKLTKKRSRRDRDGEKYEDSEKLTYLKAFYNYVNEKNTVEIPEVEKDIWDIRNLEIIPVVNPISARYTLDFGSIPQVVIKQSVKSILKMHCETKSMSSIKSELYAVNRFTQYLARKHPKVKDCKGINRDLIEDYIIYIKTETGISRTSYGGELGNLRGVLDDIGRHEEIWELCSLFLQYDISTHIKRLPKTYSDNEIERFNNWLIKLNVQLGRCLILHQLLGTRISDTLTLRMDCLFPKNGKTYININQPKTRKYSKPITDEVEKLIRKAMEYTKTFKKDSEYIFIQSNGNLFSYAMIEYQVNALIRINNILNDNGDLYNFLTHRFRHTYATKLTEMHLDDKSIACLLGQKGTRSVSYYRKLRNHVLAEDTREMRIELDGIIGQLRGGNLNG